MPVRLGKKVQKMSRGNMKYNKLVRDKIPEIIAGKGGRAVTHVADDEEYWQKLKKKLQEEVDEFMDAETAEELADVLEVIDAICEYKKFNKVELKKLQRNKASKRGKFKGHIILEKS